MLQTSVLHYFEEKHPPSCTLVNQGKSILIFNKPTCPASQYRIAPTTVTCSQRTVVKLGKHPNNEWKAFSFSTASSQLKLPSVLCFCGAVVVATAAAVAATYYLFSELAVGMELTPVAVDMTSSLYATYYAHTSSERRPCNVFVYIVEIRYPVNTGNLSLYTYSSLNIDFGGLFLDGKTLRDIQNCGNRFAVLSLFLTLIGVNTK